jgi:hypothetical protein
MRALENILVCVITFLIRLFEGILDAFVLVALRASREPWHLLQLSSGGYELGLRGVVVHGETVFEATIEWRDEYARALKGGA